MHAQSVGATEKERQLQAADAESLCWLPVQAVAHGPRATDRFAAVSAGFVVGLAAAAQAQEVGAHFLAALAARMEAAVLAQDSLAGGNLAAVVAHLYGLRLLEAGTLFSLLEHLRDRRGLTPSLHPLIVSPTYFYSPLLG